MTDQPDVDELVSVLENARNLLASADPATSLRAARHLKEVAGKLEDCVASAAHDAGMTWAEVGAVYDMTRQSAHKRFASLPVASAEVFEWLLSDERDEPAPALVAAAEVERQIVQHKGRVPYGGAR